MTKKLSIVRFKPKPEHFDEFVQLLKTRHKSDRRTAEAGSFVGFVITLK